MRLLAIQVEGLGDSTQLWKNGTRVMFVGSLQVIILSAPVGTKKIDKNCPKDRWQGFKSRDIWFPVSNFDHHLK